MLPHSTAYSRDTSCTRLRGLPNDIRTSLLCAQEELVGQHEEEHARYKAGQYQESPQDWLHSSWQGAALQVRSL